MASTPNSIQVPDRDDISDKQNKITQPWHFFFRSIKSFIDSRQASYLAQTSSNFLLSTTGYLSAEWAQMTGNKITLTPGEWILNGQIYANFTSSAPAWTEIQTYWATNNGDNTSTPPTRVTAQAGNTEAYLRFASTFMTQTLEAPTCRVSVTTNTDVYLDAKCTFTTAGDGYMKTYIYAERVRSFERKII
ncbi:MAG: hypothetical protein ACXVCP_00385 [Bdellovibrio sp.]